MIDKTCLLESIRTRFKDGMTVMVGGFGVPGTPFTLIDALLEDGASGLTLIKNEANEDHMGLSKLIEAGHAKKLITSHLGLNATVIGMMNRAEIEVEFYPQGILAEKQNKGLATVNGQRVLIEPALRADVALIHAAAADSFGNLVYEKSARNFNPAMATAAGTVIVETERLAAPGELEPDAIHTPGGFVDHVVVLDELSDAYGILEHHVL